MKKAIWKSIAVGLIAIAASVQGALAAPASFAYQGVIHQVDGAVPATKNRVIEFRLYNGPTSTDVLWGRVCNVLLDNNGLFNAPLADASGTVTGDDKGAKLADVLAQHADKTLYVGLTVDGSSGEISPRQAILAVPYAIQASDATGASGGFVVKDKLTAGGLNVTGDAQLASVTAANLSVNGKVEITGGSGMFVGPGTIPVGGIIMWSGDSGHIPDGWALCNGQNGTPNLSGKFVVGFDPNDPAYKAVGNMGGAATVTLTPEQMPKHAHDRTVVTVGYESNWNDKQEAVSFENNWSDGTKTKNNGDRNIGPGGSAGGGQAHENRPPYFVICYIMRVK